LTKNTCKVLSSFLCLGAVALTQPCLIWMAAQFYSTCMTSNTNTYKQTA